MVLEDRFGSALKPAQDRSRSAGSLPEKEPPLAPYGSPDLACAASRSHGDSRMRRLHPLALSAVLLNTFLALLACQATVVASSSNHVVFRAGFEQTELDAAWRSEGSGSANVEALSYASRVLCVVTRERGNHMVSIPLPIDQIRGFRVTLSGKVKAENVSKPAEPWNGVKFMLYTQSPKGPEYQAVMELHGTFDWKDLGLTATVPPDATEASIVLGLQDSSGKAWFDEVSLSLSASPRRRPASPPALLPPEKLDRRSDLPRLRGVMYGPKGKEEDLRKLAEWNVNLIRWQFYWYDGSFPDKRLDLALYDRWLEETIAEVDRFLPLCEKLGIRVVIDLHTPPGAGEAGQWAIFEREAYQKRFIEIWDKLAEHYKDKTAIWGYDLINEPVEGKVADGLLDWRSLAEYVAKRVRAIDPRRAIIVEPGPYGGWGNLAYFEPIDVPGIIYSVHLYEPMPFTHQGVLGGNPEGVQYPGSVGGALWNRDKLREILTPVRDYQKDYNVPIFVGEFSAARWAPGDSAAHYLADCIAIFEEFGWDWSYHAFREWHGWNVELGPDKDNLVPAPEPTSREKTLREGFSRN